IIASSKTKRPRGVSRRGSARAQILGSGPVVSPAARARARARGRAGVAPPVVPPQASTDKIMVSNLPQDVNEVQIKELFHSTVGPLRQVTLHFDSSGRSKGVAAIQFQRAGDANKAYTQYNNRLIDGSQYRLPLFASRWHRGSVLFKTSFRKSLAPCLWPSA
ncbi:hypothetical protein L208DRAFT_1237597, partial [Tricholoma matsutake]